VPFQPIESRVYQELRERLVDQTRRNRLLHFKHTAKGTMLRFVDEVPDLVLAHLQNEGRFRFQPLPDPDDEPAEERKPEFRAALAKARVTDEAYRVAIAALDPEDPSSAAKEAKVERDLRDRLRAQFGLPTRPTRRTIDLSTYATRHGVSPAYDVDVASVQAKHRDEWLQTLLFQDQLKTRTAALARKVREVEQETGVATLHLAFGFLEWFESDASDTAFSSPLLLLPVSLEKVKGKRGEEVFQLAALDNVPTTNLSLELRFKRDFGIALPEFGSGHDPVETYLCEVDDATKNLKRRKIRRFLTLAPFSFARIAMYRDLDPVNWNRIPGGGAHAHHLVRPLLRGTADEGSGDSFAGEYEIDDPEIEKAAPILISDADSSQHSAIVDVMKGKNLVVEGPPGTGKSQTIANLIANALYKGQRVLFVSEKMAALDVVKSRLDKVGLGHFCLPLHAAGAKPTAVIAALKERAAMRAPRVPPNFEAARSGIARARDALKAHLDAVHAEAGPLGETVHAYIGRLADLTRLLPSMPALLRGRVGDVPATIDHGSASEARERLEALEAAARAAESLEINVMASPFRILDRADLFPDEIEALLDGLEDLVEACGQQSAAGAELRQWLGKADSDSSAIAIGQMVSEVDAIADPPPQADRNYLGYLRSMADVEDALWTATQLDRNEHAAGVLRRAGVADPSSLNVNAVKAAIEFAGPLGVNRLTIDQVFSRARELTDQETAWGAPSDTLATLCSLLRLPADPEAGTVLLACRAAVLATEADADWHSYCSPGLEHHTAILFAAAEKQEALQARLREIGTRFNVEGVSHIALRAAAGTLRQAGFFSFLRSDVREAKAIFTKHWTGGPRPPARDWAKELSAAADVLAEQEALEHDTNLRGIVGAHGSPRHAPLRKLAHASAWLARVTWLASVTEVLSTERAEAGLVGVALKSLSTDEVRRLATLAGAARALQQFLEEQTPAGNARWSSLRANTSNRAAALATLTRGLRSTGLRGDLSLSSFPGIAAAWEEWRASRDELTSERAKAAREHAPPDLLALRSSADFAKRMIERFGTLGLFYLEDGWSDRITTLRTNAAAARAAADQTSLVLKGLASIGLQQFAAAALARDAQALHADASELVAAGAQLPPYLRFALARSSCLENVLSAAVLVAFTEAQARLHHLPEALEWLIAWSLVKRHADAQRAIFTRTGDQLSGFRQSFSENDRARIELDSKLVQKAVIDCPVPSGIASGSRSTWTDRSLLDNEFGKQRRHVPVRDLLYRAGGAVTALAPCLMMSPLTVAQYLKPGGLSFDLVVMDEASQIKPEDAVGAMLRGRQAVIVGDPKQLPPTNFFDRAIGDDDDEGIFGEGGEILSRDDLVAAESVLDLALRAFRPARRLRWHYRSQHESLIAFSNRAFYDNNLVVFPSAHARSETLGIELVRVNGVWRERINEEEAKAVASAAADFMRRHPNLSLGIVAMNQPQRDLIRAEIEATVTSDARLGDYMEKWEEALEEPFVKNLENVQGDERDVIFISLGWGRTPQGALHQRFYPVNRQDDGHRRLNVLFTRAKRKIVLFSSLQAEDILVSESSAPGVRVLRDYLGYARDGRVERGNVGDEEADSPFETSVAGALRALGHNVTLQVGVAGYRIDLAVSHPEELGRFVLGIECDGATYHSAKSARDRDRLRQEALERLGWRLARVWSTDWFRDPVGQTERLSREISSALAELPASPSARQRLIEDTQGSQPPPSDRPKPRPTSARLATKRRAPIPPRGLELEPGGPAREAEPTKTGKPATLQDALVAFRESVIMREYPGSEPARCILRDPMINLIVKSCLDDPNDFHSKIPEFYRARTDGRQMVYLQQICELVEEYNVPA
jgi:very-short-patch-repair endonuclease